MRESVIERYLHKQVVKAGGFTYKFKSPGRANVPDRIVLWPRKTFSTVWGGDTIKTITHAVAQFIELKALGKTARTGQAREHVRLQKLGVVVLIIDTKEKVDLYIERNK